jgi:hypothetical protein
VPNQKKLLRNRVGRGLSGQNQGILAPFRCPDFALPPAAQQAFKKAAAGFVPEAFLEAATIFRGEEYLLAELALSDQKRRPPKGTDSRVKTGERLFETLWGGG